MNENTYNETCLTDEEIGNLAIRLGAQRRGSVPREGQSADTSAGLSLSVDESIRGHLRRCNVCRGKLVAEVRVYRAYFEQTDTAKADAAIRRRIESDLREALRDREFKLLFHCPNESEAEKNLALAAATSREDVTPLMFAESENEGDLILKKERDVQTGKDSYYLVGSDPSFAKNSQVLIDGEIYRTGEKGKIDLGGATPTLSEDMIIIVFPGGSV